MATVAACALTTTTQPAVSTTILPAATVAPIRATAPVPVLPGYEVAGVPAGWTRVAEILDGETYRIQYYAPVANGDPLARVEADGRRISLIVGLDPDGKRVPLASGYPGHPAIVAGLPATLVETAPPPGGRHGVAWKANGLAFEVYAYMEEPALLRLAATVTPTGRPVVR